MLSKAFIREKTKTEHYSYLLWVQKANKFVEISLAWVFLKRDNSAFCLILMILISVRVAISLNLLKLIIFKISKYKISNLIKPNKNSKSA